MISIRQPLFFSEIGRKENQEDFLFPQEPEIDSRVFILCDGMGGHDNGEVASMTVATVLGSFLEEKKDVTELDFADGLEKSYDALDEIDTFTSKKPGTTLACICVNPESCLVAHIGDSRIYHIRPSLFNPSTKRGGILYQSSDHSLVNELLKAGEITEEEARDFPQKNVITRALQPHLPKRFKADTYTFDNIKQGDYFFLCSDGVLEQLSNDSLCSILANPKLSDKEKLEEIRDVCRDKTRDNYSCWLIPIDRVEISDNIPSLQVIKAEATDGDTAPAPEKQSATPKTRRISIPLPSLPDLKRFPMKRILRWSVIAIIMIAALLLSCHFLFGREKSDSTDGKDSQITEKVVEVSET